jgi:hypothetical protein
MGVLTREKERDHRRDRENGVRLRYFVGVDKNERERRKRETT